MGYSLFCLKALSDPAIADGIIEIGQRIEKTTEIVHWKLSIEEQNQKNDYNNDEWNNRQSISQSAYLLQSDFIEVIFIVGHLDYDFTTNLDMKKVWVCYSEFRKSFAGSRWSSRGSTKCFKKVSPFFGHDVSNHRSTWTRNHTCAKLDLWMSFLICQSHFLAEATGGGSTAKSFLA